MTGVRVTAKTARLLRVLLKVHEEQTKAKALGNEYHMSSRMMMQRAQMTAVTYYPLIARLVENGWVKEVKEKLPKSVTRPPRHFYHLTPVGHTLAEKAVAEDDKRWSVLRNLRGKR